MVLWYFLFLWYGSVIRKVQLTVPYLVLECAVYLQPAIGVTLIASVMDLRTWSCLHRYQPSPNGLEQLLRMCPNVPILDHRGHQVFLFCPMCTGWMDLGGHHRSPELRTLLCWFALSRLKHAPPPVLASASPFRWPSHIGSLLGSQVQLCLASLLQGWSCASVESLFAGLHRLPSTSSLSSQ